MLQTKRTDAKLTQKELAEKAEITQSAVAQLEHGSLVLTIAMLEKICKALECKSIDILGF